MATPFRKTYEEKDKMFVSKSLPLKEVKEELHKQGKSKLAMTFPMAAPKYNKDTLLMALNLRQITLGDSEVVKSPSCSSPTLSPLSPFSSVQPSGGLIASAGIGKDSDLSSPEKTGSMPNSSLPACSLKSCQDEDTCTSISGMAGLSGLDGKLYEELTEETEQHIIEVMSTGARIDACEAIRKVMETIMSMIIVSRCTNKEKSVFDQEKAEEMLKKFVEEFSPSQGLALDLLLELEELDKLVSILASRYYNFPMSSNTTKKNKNDQEKPEITHDDFLQQLENIKKCIDDIEPNAVHTSKVFDASVEFFNQSLPTLLLPLKNKAKKFGRSNFDLLKKVGQEMKFGTTHKIVTDMHVEMKSLADGKLNGFIFYPEHDTNKLKRRRGRPLLTNGAKRIEDIIDGVEKFQKAETMESFDNVDELFEEIGSLATLYFSSYVPEMGGEKEQEKGLSEDYIEFNISLVTKLVPVDSEVKKQLRAVYVHNKMRGILQDYRSLLQDNGYLREELELLRSTNRELEQRNNSLEAQLKEYMQRFDDSFGEVPTDGENNEAHLEPKGLTKSDSFC